MLRARAHILIRKIKRLQAHGGTLRALGVSAAYPLRYFYRGLHRYSAAFRHAHLVERQFDLALGVDTRERASDAYLECASPNWEYGHGYVPTALEGFDFKQIIGRLKIRYEDFTFIDFGSGKGRVLLLASEFPFRRVIGVEYLPELHRTAERNITGFRSGIRKCGELRSICMDVVDYQIPAEPLICYFFNPFTEPVMAAVLKGLGDSFTRQPRPIFVVYKTPKLAYLFDSAPFLRRLPDIESCAVYASGMRPLGH